MRYRSLLTFAYFVHIAIGISLTAIGPVIPLLGTVFDVGYAAFGPLLFIASLTYVLSVYFAGRLCHRWGTRTPALLGVGIAGLALLLLRWSPSWAWVVALYSLYNVGFGFMDAGFNTVVPQVRSDAPSAALNRLHVFSAFGAAIGPVVSWAGIHWLGLWHAPYSALGIAYLALGTVALKIEFPAAPKSNLPAATLQKRQVPGRTLALLGLAMILYVGTETGVSTWMVTYLVEHLGSGAGIGAGANSLFWLGLSMGRMLLGPHTERIGYERSIRTFAIGAAVALLPALIVSSVVVAFACFFLTGFAFSGTFPTIIALGRYGRPEEAGTTTGVLIACAGVGGMLLPSLQGYVAELFGIHISMGLAYIGTLGLLGVVLALPRPRIGGDQVIEQNEWVR